MVDTFEQVKLHAMLLGAQPISEGSHFSNARIALYIPPLPNQHRLLRIHTCTLYGRPAIAVNYVDRNISKYYESFLASTQRRFTSSDEAITYINKLVT
jgi:hypothetical protein